MKTTFTLTKKFTFFFLFATMLIGASVSAQTFRVFDPATQEPFGSTAGAQANFSAGSPTATGLRFQVVQGGTANAVHFYQGDNNTGPHVVNLWRIDGTNLGTATLPADATRGWRTVALPGSITLAPGITYVVSVHSSSGFIARTGNTWPAGDYTASPGLIVLGNTASTVDPPNSGNGVVAVNVASNVMPNSTAPDPNASNYWVDISYTTFFPLPVTLTDFKAAASGSVVNVSWKTEYEANNKGFAIERSNNGSDWYEVNFVKGVGQSNETKSYSYVDKGVAPGNYQYRLRQVDFDGKSVTSPVVAVEIEGRGKVALAHQGLNPFSGSTRMRFDLPSAQRVRLSLLDINGREIKTLVNGTKETGSHVVTIDATGLSPQLYYVRLQTESGTLTQKIVVQ